MSAVFMSPHWLNLTLNSLCNHKTFHKSNKSSMTNLTPKITQNQNEQQLVKMTAPK